ncbi:MAG: 2-oxo acid dehydrogenase subunit E2 [Desulfobacterales bacterium]|jgi:pyruvate dehydrogenase E2 component (dihydrolipoamide acetyltransferase)|nr:2-oxo acid dehydrogenase subunit E2 [Desulfobacterales bacterium]
MIKEIKIPDISENVTFGTVVGILVSPGDEVDVDDPIIELETDKAVVEIPSPYKGRITEIVVKEGDEKKVGDVIAKIDTEPTADVGKEAGREKAPKADAEIAAAETEKKPADAKVVEENREEEEKEEWVPTPASSPSVRRFAREMGVDIHAVPPAGPGDRITETDVKRYVKQVLAAGGKRSGSAAREEARAGLPDFSRWGEIETRELGMVRRLTAESTSVAWRSVVHVTQFERADITGVTAFIRQQADKVADQGGKLTLTTVLMKICAAALLRFPQFNASIDLENNRLILKKYVHIGLAVDTPRGLLVPVVRNVDRKTMTALSIEIVDLARRARDKKIKPDEMEGGSFTISNQGGIGGTNFTPVVFWPQAAILGISRASTEPEYFDGEVRPRTMLPLALSYDHRIMDGADAARFLNYIRECIEQPLILHLDLP